MGNIEDWRNYYEDLTKNLLALSHDPDNDRKRFYEIMLEEIISGITHKLPSNDDGAFLIWSGYIDRMRFQEISKSDREMMFFVMQSVGSDKDYSLYAPAKANCENIINDIISKMVKDSRDEHPLFDQAFNRAENITKIETQFKIGSVTYIGWQVSIQLVVYPNLCFNPLNWKP